MPGPETVVVLRVKPRSKRAGLAGWHGDALKLGVHAAPERGQANAEVIEILRHALGVPASALAIESGASARDKRVRVMGLDATEVRRRVDAALRAAGGSRE